MVVREKLHRLVDELPDDELRAAERYLEYLRDTAGDRVLRALQNAPIDDEPLTEQDLEAISEADEAIARGEAEPWEEARQELRESA